MATETVRNWTLTDACMDYKRGTADWKNVPGWGDVSISSPAPSVLPSASTKTVARSLGRAEPPSLSVSIARAHLSDKFMADMKALRASGANVQFRFYNDEEDEIVGDSGSGNTIALAANTGAVTIVGTPSIANLNDHPEVGPGTAIKTGTGASLRYNIIESFDATSGALSSVKFRNNPTTAVAASTYSFVLAPWHMPAFNCRVSSFDITFPQEGAITATMELVATAELPDLGIGPHT